MSIVFSLLSFFLVILAIYYLFKLWNNYDYYKSQSEIFFFYKTFSKEELLEMHRKLSEEELANNKSNKHYKIKLSIYKAIELKNGKDFDALAHRQKSLQFAKEFIHSLRSTKND